MEWINAFLSFIWNHYLDILCIIILVGGGIFIWKRSPKGKKYIAMKLRILVEIAEETWGSAKGKTKFAQVYDFLPFIIKLIYSKEEISTIVDKTLDILETELKEIEDATIECVETVAIKPPEQV